MELLPGIIIRNSARNWEPGIPAMEHGRYGDVISFKQILFIFPAGIPICTYVAGKLAAAKFKA